MKNCIKESMMMGFCRTIGFERLAWSLRRLYCPVEHSALVLEVGSGGNPYFRANVLLDAFEATRQRHWAPLVTDRPTVLGEVEHLPFSDKAFDFVIASHVLEHSSDPEAFLLELQRVARAGYIEVPDAIMERLNPYHDHRLEITARDNTLIIRKKPFWKVDSELVELYETQAQKIITGETIPHHPFAFHVRYYWKDRISFQVLNPEIDASWLEPVNTNKIPAQGLRARINAVVLSMVRSIFSQRVRNRNIRLSELLACPACRSTDLESGQESIRCNKCALSFPIRNGIPVMFSKAKDATVPHGK